MENIQVIILVYNWQIMMFYKVFIKYCGFFSKNSRKFATFPSPSTWLLLVVQKITNQ